MEGTGIKILLIEQFLFNIYINVLFYTNRRTKNLTACQNKVRLSRVEFTNQRNNENEHVSRSGFVFGTQASTCQQECLYD